MSEFACKLCDEDFDRNKKLPRRLECGCVYCEQCLKMFTKINKFYKCQSHRQRSSKLIKSLEVAQEYLKPEAGKQQDQQSQMCHHHQEMYKFFCSDDDEKVCGTCTITNHEGHNFISLEQKFHGIKRQIALEIQALEDQLQADHKIKAYKAIQQTLGSKLVYLRQEALNTQGQLHSLIDQICLRELRIQLEDLSKSNQENTQKLTCTINMQSKIFQTKQKQTNSIEECQLIIKELQELKGEYERIKNSLEGQISQDSEVNQLIRAFKSKINQHLVLMYQFEENQEFNTQQSKNFQYEKEIKDLYQQIESLKIQNANLNQDLAKTGRQVGQVTSSLKEMEKVKENLEEQVRQLTLEKIRLQDEEKVRQQAQEKVRQQAEDKDKQKLVEVQKQQIQNEPQIRPLQIQEKELHPVKQPKIEEKPKEITYDKQGITSRNQNKKKE